MIVQIYPFRIKKVKPIAESIAEKRRRKKERNKESKSSKKKEVDKNKRVIPNKKNSNEIITNKKDLELNKILIALIIIRIILRLTIIK